MPTTQEHSDSPDAVGGAAGEAGAVPVRGEAGAGTLEVSGLPGQGSEVGEAAQSAVVAVEQRKSFEPEGGWPAGLGVPKLPPPVAPVITPAIREAMARAAVQEGIDSVARKAEAIVEDMFDAPELDEPRVVRNEQGKVVEYIPAPKPPGWTDRKYRTVLAAQRPTSEAPLWAKVAHEERLATRRIQAGQEVAAAIGIVVAPRQLNADDWTKAAANVNKETEEARAKWLEKQGTQDER